MAKSVFRQKDTLVPAVGDEFTVLLQSDRDLTLSPIEDFFGMKTKVPEWVAGAHFSDQWDETFQPLAVLHEVDVDTAKEEIWATFEWRLHGTNVPLGALIGQRFILEPPPIGRFIDRKVNIKVNLQVVDVFQLEEGDATGNPEGVFERAQETLGEAVKNLKFGSVAVIIIAVIAGGVWLKNSGVLPSAR